MTYIIRQVTSVGQVTYPSEFLLDNAIQLAKDEHNKDGKEYIVENKQTGVIVKHFKK